MNVWNSGNEAKSWKGVCRGLVLVATVSVSAAGCASPPKVKAYSTSNQCAIAKEGSAVLVQDKRARANAPANSLVISLADDAKNSDAAKKKKKSEPLFDLQQHWIVRVAMGERPSGGYGFSLAAEEMQVQDGVARVLLNWDKPAADSMTPQVMTYPCTYLQLEKGDYHKVEIVDQHGKVRYTIDLPEGDNSD